MKTFLLFALAVVVRAIDVCKEDRVNLVAFVATAPVACHHLFLAEKSKRAYGGSEACQVPVY